MKRTRAAKESSSARWESSLATATPISTPSGERTPITSGVAQVDVAVGALAVGPDQGDDDDHQQRGGLALDLREAEEDRQRGHEEDAAADADQAAGEPAGERDQDREELVHQKKINSIAIATRRAAKSSEIARWGMRCWIAVPATTPITAGIESQRPVRTWTLP